MKMDHADSAENGLIYGWMGGKVDRRANGREDWRVLGMKMVAAWLHRYRTLVFVD